jgi:hypothetical protein
MFDFHTIEAPDGGQPLYNDRIIVAVRNNVANASGSTSVATSVNFPAFALPVDASGNALYGVHVTPSQDCTVAVTNKTSSGFTVTLFATAVAAGSFDCLVIA